MNIYVHICILSDVFVCVFYATPCGSQGLQMTLHTEINPGRLMKTYVMPRIKSGSAICKAKPYLLCYSSNPTKWILILNYKIIFLYDFYLVLLSNVICNSANLCIGVQNCCCITKRPKIINHCLCVASRLFHISLPLTFSSSLDDFSSAI